MSMIIVSITYDVTTPESAEHGDTADHGFYGPGGHKYSIANESFENRVKAVGRDQAIKDMTPDPEMFCSVQETIDFIRRDGPFEAEGSRFTQCCPSGDRAYFERGEDTRLTYHVTCSPQILEEITAYLG